MTTPRPALSRTLDKARLSEQAATEDQVLDDKFQTHAADFLLPTARRPALITPDEIVQIKTGYSTGAGRLKVLETVTGRRLEFWLDANGGGPPIDPISGADRAKCEEWFKRNPPLLATSSLK